MWRNGDEGGSVKLYRNFSTQDEIDKEYNPSTSVSNADYYIQWYVDESAAVRRELACELEMKEKAGMSSRCIPFAQEKLGDVCACCGKPAKHMIYWGVAY